MNGADYILDEYRELCHGVATAAADATATAIADSFEKINFGAMAYLIDDISKARTDDEAYERLVLNRPMLSGLALVGMISIIENFLLRHDEDAAEESAVET